GGDIQNLIVVKIQTGHSVRGPRLRGLFFQMHRAALFVEIDDTIAFRIAYRIGKDRRAALARLRLLQRPAEAVAVKNIVAENQRDGAFTNNLPADEKGLSDPPRFRLRSVRDIEAQPAAVLQQ